MDEEFTLKEELEYAIINGQGDIKPLMDEIGDAEFNRFIMADFINLDGDTWKVKDFAKEYYSMLFGKLNYWLLQIKIFLGHGKSKK